MSRTAKFPMPVMGIDSLSDEASLSPGTVREAVNVDIARGGQFRRRVGQVLRLPGNTYHSLWLAQQRGVVLVADGSTVLKVNPDLSTEPISTLNSPDKLSFVEYNGNVYWTNRTTIQWLPSDSVVVRGVGVPVPEVLPALEAAGGSLRSGKYGVSITYVDDRGEEGGATPVQFVDLPSGGGIRLVGLPTTHPDWQMYVYITDPDGEVLRFAASLPAVFPNYIVSETARGSELDTKFLQPLPPGDFVAWLGGRLYTAKNNTLFFSNALRPHLYNPAHNFVQFSGYISFIEAVTDGLYVGDSRGVWFLRGVDPTKFEMSLVSTCRAVRRSSVKIPPEHLPEKKVTSDKPVALWLSTSGYVVGMDGGVTVELQPDRVKVPAGLEGRTTYLFRRGIKQVVTPVNSTSTLAFGIADNSVIQ